MHGILCEHPPTVYKSNSAGLHNSGLNTCSHPLGGNSSTWQRLNKIDGRESELFMSPALTPLGPVFITVGRGKTIPSLDLSSWRDLQNTRKTSALRGYFLVPGAQCNSLVWKSRHVSSSSSLLPVGHGICSHQYLPRNCWGRKGKRIGHCTCSHGVRVQSMKKMDPAMKPKTDVNLQVGQVVKGEHATTHRGKQSTVKD